MNFELFIVKRIIAGASGKKTGINVLVNISVTAIALSLAVMIISVSVLTGFKTEIKDKLTGFGSHIQISNLDNNNSYEAEPVELTPTLLARISQIPNVRGIYPFATKPGIVKSGKELQGIILKGVDPGYNWAFLSANLVDGRLPDAGNQDTLDILISGSLAKLLNLRTGMKLPAYFVQEPPRMRPFVISGIYRTGLEEYDRLFAWCGIDQIREINDWTAGLASGYEVLLDDPAKMEATASAIREITDAEGINKSNLLQVRTIREIAPGFFDFLSLTDTNVWVILALMILIAGFNMISGLLIIILDRTRMIGILKALGTDNRSMVRIFLNQAAFITGKGLLIGNLIGLALSMIQDKFRIIPLDPGSYFVDSVPVLINPLHLILLNAGTLVLTILMLLVPSGVIARISPDKTIKFD